MSYTIEIRDDLAVIVVTFHDDFSGEQDIKAYTQEIFDVYENLDAPIYQIADCSELKLGFNDVMTFIKEGVLGEKSTTSHKNNKGNAVVTASRFYQMAIKGFNTASFGNLKMEIFGSMDDALNWVRNQVA